MTNVVFLAAPGAVPPPPGSVTPFPGLAGMRWEAWDGKVWDLLNLRSGVALHEGVRGLAMPPVDRFTSTSPALAGSRFRGSRTLEREVFWPVFIWSDASSEEWVAHDRAFWRGMHPDKPGTWVVRHPDGTERRLRLRFVDDGGHAFGTDPTRRGWELYGVSLIAEQPLWEGPTVHRAWKASEPVPFFGNGAPHFYISSANTLAGATIRNDGDVPAWPVWRITGPTESVAVGVGGRVVEIPFPLADGETLTIDTRPDVQTAVDEHGNDRTDELGAVDFAAIPEGGEAALSLSMNGTGFVSAEMTPLYFRAW